MIERIINTDAAADDPIEQEIEFTLRPRDFTNYIGQERLKQNLQLAIRAAKKRGEPLDHILLYGPPGQAPVRQLPAIPVPGYLFCDQ